MRMRVTGARVGWRTLLAIAFAAALLVLPATARAFDTGPHADMTRDALTAEGFSPAAASIGAVNNWFVDYYTNPDKNPYSGHANALIGVTRLGLARESWPNFWVEAARRLHFDFERRTLAMADLSKTEGIEREWQRLMWTTRYRQLHFAAQKNDPLQVLAIVGMTLHAVQDFYSHSNWVEDPGPENGRGGPGIASLGYGSTPTWFDVPPEVRRTLVDNREVYTGVRGIPRGHGHWRSDDSKSLHAGLNKDWTGRPKYQEAYVTAYFASRQWVRAMRTWLGNEPLWRRAMAMRHTPALAHDVTGATEISQFSGHWDGGGEPCVPFSCGVRTGKAGSVVSLRLAIGDYHDRGPTPYRRAFNEMIGEWAKFPETIPPQADLPSSRTEQVLTRFVKLEVLDYRGFALGDPIGDADIYANARIGGQPYTSTVINGEQSFTFPGVYQPFTWIRSVPTFNRASTPVTSMTVRIETGDRRFAGTDDDVYLRVNRNLRFSLDKRLYDDFERGDNDTYSVPIGDATRNGLTVGDIDRVAIEKSKDGVAGGWFLHGVTLVVNGQVLVSNRRIDRWLEDSRRVWTAPGFVRDQRTDDVVGVWLQLRDDDFGPNDTGDVNEYDRHTSAPVAYRLGTAVRRRVAGGDRLRGRLSMDNGDSARLTYRLSTFASIPPPAPAPPPQPGTPPPPDPPPGPPAGPGPNPDLVISSFTGTEFTVRNDGAAAAGPFRVRVRSTPTGDTNFEFPGLAVGESQTRAYSRPCEEAREARADSLNQVPESSETNNTASYANSFC
jgi:PLAT/LH2 domain-containing protein/CARDB protein